MFSVCLVFNFRLCSARSVCKQTAYGAANPLPFVFGELRDRAAVEEV